MVEVLSDPLLASMSLGLREVNCEQINVQQSNPYQQGMIFFGAPFAGMNVIRSIQFAILVTEDNHANRALYKDIVRRIKKISTRGKKLFHMRNNEMESFYWASEGAVEHCSAGFPLCAREGMKLTQTPPSDYSVVDEPENI